MSLEVLKKAHKVIGLKQVNKAIGKNVVTCVFLGSDADKHIGDRLKEACQERKIAVIETFSMMELGKACSIEVGAAAVALVEPK